MCAYFKCFIRGFILLLEIKLNILSLNHKLVRCPSLERDWSSEDHVPIPGWVTPQIFIHTVTVVSGSPTQQQTSLTPSAGMVYTFSFSFVLVCFVIIDPVQQGDAQLSHPICQVSAVPVIVSCSVLAILCWVMYLMVWRFALNHEGTTTVHTRLGTSICVTCCSEHLVDCLLSVHLGGSWMCLLSYCWLHHMGEHSILL